MILCVCPNPSIDTYAWLDHFEQGSVNRIDKLREFPGGKGTHVAFALKQLGSEVSLFANWAGNHGDWIKDACQKAGIKTIGIAVEGNNRKCYSFRSEDSNFDNTELLEPGPQVTKKDWEDFIKMFSSQVVRFDLVCMSGSWPKGAPEDAYFQLLRICEQNGTKAILDCSGVQLKNALKVRFFGLHINEPEAKEAFGANHPNEIFDYLKAKVSLVALTKGKEGLYLHSNNKTLHSNVTIDKVLSTVGSGDCLTAGITYSVSNKLNLEDTSKYGVACGGANCLNEDLGMLRASDVQRLYKEVVVAEV